MLLTITSNIPINDLTLLLLTIKCQFNIEHFPINPVLFTDQNVVEAHFQLPIPCIKVITHTVIVKKTNSGQAINRNCDVNICCPIVHVTLPIKQ